MWVGQRALGRDVCKSGLLLSPIRFCGTWDECACTREGRRRGRRRWLMKTLFPFSPPLKFRAASIPLLVLLAQRVGDHEFFSSHLLHNRASWEVLYCTVSTVQHMQSEEGVETNVLDRLILAPCAPPPLQHTTRHNQRRGREHSFATVFYKCRKRDGQVERGNRPICPQKLCWLGATCKWNECVH